MGQLQNILVALVVAAAVVYVIRAMLIACGYRQKRHGNGCGGCATCPSKSRPDVVELKV